MTLFDLTSGAPIVNEEGTKAKLQVAPVTHHREQCWCSMHHLDHLQVDFRCRWTEPQFVDETWRFEKAQLNDNFIDAYCSWCYEKQVHSKVKPIM